MRTDLTSADRALLDSGDFDLHWKFLCDNGSGTAVDLSGRIHRMPGYKPPNPNEPASTITFALHRELDRTANVSLALFVEGSTLNRLDDGTTYSALLEIGRDVVASCAITARGAARPATGYYEVLSGKIGRVDWPRYEDGDVIVFCRDKAGELQKVKSETAYTYAAGISIEAAIQQTLDNNGYSALTLYTPTATGKVLSVQHAPGVQKTIWQQVWNIAQSIGWVCWFRYKADGTVALTLFEPDRNKTVSDFTVAKLRDYNAVGKYEDELGNVGYLEYSDSNGVRQTVGPVVDNASISKYGWFRRSFWISLPDDSPVRDETGATALLTAAVSDTADPDTIGELVTPGNPFLECAVDLITVPADGRISDTARTYAPFSITVGHAADKDHESRINVRGKPSAGYKTWTGPSKRAVVNDDPEAKLLQNFRARDSADGLSEVITWTNGAKLEEVWIATRTVEGVVQASDWTALAAAVESKGLISTYTVTKPTETDGTARTTLVQIEGTYTDPATGNLVTSDAWVRTIRPKVAIAAIDPASGDLADGAVKRAAQVSDGVLTAANMLESLRRFASDVAFSASDNDTVAWGAGTIVLADGTTYSITAGNTGNMLAPTFIYLDAAVSTTALQTTTTLATAVGDRKLLVCYARPIAAATQFAMYVPAVGLLGMNEENLQANSVNANHITGISLSVLQAVVNQLSALTADLGTVTAGTIATSVSITVGASTTYEAGYDPSTKETPAGAQSKADAAESDAKLYADGLVTPLGAIILATTAPTTRSGGSALVAGDMWLDTDDGNKPYTWTGSAWGAAYTRIDGGSIVTGTIQAGIVFAGQLSAATGTFAGALSASTIDTQGMLQIDIAARSYLENPGLKWVSGANAARVSSGDAINIELRPHTGGYVDFQNTGALPTGKAAVGTFLPIKVGGTIHYIALYS